MTLRQKQSRFVVLVAQLIEQADLHMGVELTFGDAYRSPEEAARLAKAGKGIKTSLHCQRLAIDFNLFIGGVFQTSSEAFKPLGEWWERQSTTDYTCCWGGRFKDGNHFSIEHNGRK